MLLPLHFHLASTSIPELSVSKTQRMQSSPVVASKFHFTKPVVVGKQRPNFFRSPENLKFKCFNRIPDYNLVIPITSAISTRLVTVFKTFTFFICTQNRSGQWLIIALFLGAYGISQSASISHGDRFLRLSLFTCSFSILLLMLRPMITHLLLLFMLVKMLAITMPMWSI